MAEEGKKRVQKIELFLTDISSVVCLAVTFMIVLDIALRYLFNKPLPASWEISEVLMPYIVFFPLAYTLSIGGHVRVSFIKERVSVKMQNRFDIISNTISFLFCLMITYWSWLRFWESVIKDETILAAVYVPWWVGKIAMPIGMFLFSLRYLFCLMKNISQSKNN